MAQTLEVNKLPIKLEDSTPVAHFEGSPRKKQFDPLTHVPPKYDVFGRLKKVAINPNKQEFNILKDQDKITIPWQKGDTGNNKEPMTRTKLFENRKKERIPDPSFDLDRDGFVGGRDYILAKRFDKDNDGRLNEKESKEAYDAIKGGYEDNFVWNLENQGSKRGYRIMQKRGKIIDAENFYPLKDTYPLHPLSAKKPEVGTLSELKEKRKQANEKQINEKMKKWIEQNIPQYIEEPAHFDYKHIPQYNSMKEMKKARHISAREKCGLLPIESDIKITNKDPTLAYIHQPKYKTNKDLQDKQKKENIKYSEFLKHTHKTDVERLNEREEELFAEGYKTHDRFTHSKLRDIRRKENLEYNMKTFSRQTIGVHGQELPKFADYDEMKEYWKLKQDYKEKPNFNSQVEFKENIKYWKKPEELLLKEHTNEFPDPDPFRKEKVISKHKKELITKINKLNHFKNFDPDNPIPIDPENIPRRHIYRWTTLVNQFCPQKFSKGRYFDSLPVAVEKRSDNDPMYSSFVENVVLSPTVKQLFKHRDDIKHLRIEGEKAQVDNNVNNAKDNLYIKFSGKEAKGEKQLNIRTKAF